jgi:hypothetical protein
MHREPLTRTGIDLDSSSFIVQDVDLIYLYGGRSEVSGFEPSIL